MSSISSGIDPIVKYQRLSAEYIKIRSQVSVLKTALTEEQNKYAELHREITIRDTKLRKAESERDSLAFRNEQLVKRVESLQESLDAQMAAFGGTGKKNHKAANLRLVAESNRMQSQTLGSGSSASDPQAVLEEELERKIMENGELHSKIFDLEKRYDENTAELIQRIDELRNENAALRRKSSNNNGGIRQQQNGIKASLKTEEANYTGNEPEDLITNNCNDTQHPCDKNKSTSNAPMIIKDDNLDCESHSPSLTAADFSSNSTTLDALSSRHDVTTTTSSSQSQSSDGKPSDSAISLDSVEPTETAESEEVAIKRKILEDYYTDRITTLTKSLQHATGRATYYKQECEELVRGNIVEHREMQKLQKKIHVLEDKCAMLYDTLERTQQNYEQQMRLLNEHIANRDSKIEEQAEQLMVNSSPTNHNNSNGSMSSLLRPKKATAENGHASRKKERRITWFSSFSAGTATNSSSSASNNAD